MSHTATEKVFEHSNAKGATLLVALVYAEAVKQKDVDEGRRWLAWPSQRRVAKRAKISERMVRFALAKLCAEGEMRRTGELKGRGAVVYEWLAGAPERQDEVTDYRSGNGLPDEDSQEREVQKRASGNRRNRSGNGQPLDPVTGCHRTGREPELSEPEGVFSDSDSGIEANNGNRVETGETFNLPGEIADRNGKAGDYEPDEIADAARALLARSGR